MAVATDELKFLVRQNISASIYSTCWGREVGFFNPKLCIRELTDRAVRGMTLIFIWESFIFSNPL